MTLRFKHTSSTIFRLVKSVVYYSVPKWRSKKTIVRFSKNTTTKLKSLSRQSTRFVLFMDPIRFRIQQQISSSNDCTQVAWASRMSPTPKIPIIKELWMPVNKTSCSDRFIGSFAEILFPFVACVLMVTNGGTYSFMPTPNSLGRSFTAELSVFHRTHLQVADRECSADIPDRWEIKYHSRTKTDKHVLGGVFQSSKMCEHLVSKFHQRMSSSKRLLGHRLAQNERLYKHGLSELHKNLGATDS